MSHPVSVPTVPHINLHVLKASCAGCSMHQLCLPMGLDSAEIDRLDDIIGRRRRVLREDADRGIPRGQRPPRDGAALSPGIACPNAGRGAADGIGRLQRGLGTISWGRPSMAPFERPAAW